VDSLELASADQFVELGLADIEHPHGALDPDADRCVSFSRLSEFASGLAGDRHDVTALAPTGVPGKSAIAVEERLQHRWHEVSNRFGLAISVAIDLGIV
jgi:hypothetical protein